MTPAYRTADDPRTLEELLLAIGARDGARDAIAAVARRLGSDPARHPTAIEFLHTWGIGQRWCGRRAAIFENIAKGTVLGAGTFITITRVSWYSDDITMRDECGTDYLYRVPRWCYRVR
jgi:hypothetical protein